jgi:hypothetical protein
VGQLASQKHVKHREEKAKQHWRRKENQVSQSYYEWFVAGHDEQAATQPAF